MTTPTDRRSVREEELASYYQTSFDEGRIPTDWEDARCPQFTAPKTWDGFVDLGNNRIIVKEEASQVPDGRIYRVSCRYGSITPRSFKTPWDAMAYIKEADLRRLEVPRDGTD